MKLANISFPMCVSHLKRFLGHQEMLICCVYPMTCIWGLGILNLAWFYRHSHSTVETCFKTTTEIEWLPRITAANTVELVWKTTHWPQKCGLSRQVISGDRFICIEIWILPPNVWSFKTCGLSWQWSLKTGFTVGGNSFMQDITTGLATIGHMSIARWNTWLAWSFLPFFDGVQ